MTQVLTSPFAGLEQTSVGEQPQSLCYQCLKDFFSREKKKTESALQF